MYNRAVKMAVSIDLEGLAMLCVQFEQQRPFWLSGKGHLTCQAPARIYLVLLDEACCSDELARIVYLDVSKTISIYVVGG